MSGQNPVRTGHVSQMGDGDSEKYERLQDYLGRSGIWSRKNHPIKYGAYFKSGGFAPFSIAPASAEERPGSVRFLNGQDVACRGIGPIIVAAYFELAQGDAGKICDTAEAVHIARPSCQEFVHPTLGSTISSDIYRPIVRNDRLYRNLYFLAKSSLENPVMKFVTRRRPRNDVFNRLLGANVSRKTGAPLHDAMSVRGANIVVSDSRHTSGEKRDYNGFDRRIGRPGFSRRKRTGSGRGYLRAAEFRSGSFEGPGEIFPLVAGRAVRKGTFTIFAGLHPHG